MEPDPKLLMEEHPRPHRAPAGELGEGPGRPVFEGRTKGYSGLGFFVAAAEVIQGFRRWIAHHRRKRAILFSGHGRGPGFRRKAAPIRTSCSQNHEEGSGGLTKGRCARQPNE